MQTASFSPAWGQETSDPLPMLLISIAGAIVADGVLAVEARDEEAAELILSCFNGEGEMIAQFSPEGLRLLEWSPEFAINLDIPARMTGPSVYPLGEGKRITDDGAVVCSETPELTEETLSQMMAPEGLAPPIKVCVVGVGEQAYGMREIHRSEWYFDSLPPVDEYLTLRLAMRG